MSEAADTGCCPRFDPAPWENSEVEFDEKLFVRDRVRCVFHIPLTFGKVMTRLLEKIERADESPDDYLLLADDNSLWGCDVNVSKEVPGADNVRLSGKFLTKTFEGPFKDCGKWHKEMNAHIESAGHTAKKTYAFYTTCPKFAKAYGKNWVVLLSEI